MKYLLWGLLILFSQLPSYAQVVVEKQTSSSDRQDNRKTKTQKLISIKLNIAMVDEQSQPVYGLSQDDFTIYEDDVPQKIRSFITKLMRSVGGY
jgi:hypothetical protein